VRQPLYERLETGLTYEYERAPSRPGRNWEPSPWTTYFERELFLTPDAPPSPSSSSITYHAYLNSPSPSGGPLFVTHHGAGSSGLSFALLAAEIRRLLPNAGILSLDARGHGFTTVTSAPGTPSDELDLSLQTLTDDLYAVITLAQQQMAWAQLPPLVLVGHSLGGAVVTSLAKEPRDLAPKILGHAVLDVVEGSAIDALQSMHSYLSTRPSGFASLESAIEWHVRSRTIRNSASARTSVPSLLVLQSDTSTRQQPQESDAPTTLAEATSPDADAAPSPRPSRPWRWRTDLAATQPFWEGWFVGLSRKFLEARGGKLLLLAGTDRLDTELTIGQMQGKYALQVFPEAGHFIHEDLPEKTAVSLVDFFRRNDRSALVLPPKVGDLLRQGKKV
jgi:protein phosphatase methylesterase 1